MSAPVRVGDLPEVRGRRLADGGYVEPIRPVLWCSSCNGEWSATPGDYWNLSADHVFTCDDCCDGDGNAPVLLQLVTFRRVAVPWRAK